MPIHTTVIPSQPYSDDGITTLISGNIVSVRNLGIDTAQLKDGAVTGAKLGNVGVITQLVRSTATSVNFTPTSATHNVIIMAKFYGEQDGVSPQDTIVYLRDGTTVLDTNRCKGDIVNDNISDEWSDTPTLIWSGNLTVASHSINVLTTGLDSSAYYQILIIETKPLS